MQEIEAKFHVMDLAKIGARLGELKVRLIQPRILETNIRFDLPDGGLRSEGRVLRLRQDTEARLTYKSGGVNVGGIVNRKEIEFVVDDFEKAKSFLEALGYQKILAYEKYRTTYEFGICRIMLDELPYGNFVEIEGEDLESIGATADLLHLNWNVAIATGYLDLFERARRVRGLTFTDLTFANFGGLNITVEELSVHAADR